MQPSVQQTTPILGGLRRKPVGYIYDRRTQWLGRMRRRRVDTSRRSYMTSKPLNVKPRALGGRVQLLRRRDGPLVYKRGGHGSGRPGVCKSSCILDFASLSVYAVVRTTIAMQSRTVSLVCIHVIEGHVLKAVCSLDQPSHWYPARIHPKNLQHWQSRRGRRRSLYPEPVQRSTS